MYSEKFEQRCVHKVLLESYGSIKAYSCSNVFEYVSFFFLYRQLYV
jgi:hypothetical protein